MLALEQHVNCGGWHDTNKADAIATESIPQWDSLKYSCLKVMQTYCKIFNHDELIDLIVRYKKKPKQKPNKSFNFLLNLGKKCFVSFLLCSVSFVFVYLYIHSVLLCFRVICNIRVTTIYQCHANFFSSPLPSLSLSLVHPSLYFCSIIAYIRCPGSKT